MEWKNHHKHKEEDEQPYRCPFAHEREYSRLKECFNGVGLRYPRITQLKALSVITYFKLRRWCFFFIAFGIWLLGVGISSSIWDDCLEREDDGAASYKVAPDQYRRRVVFEKCDHMWVYLQKERFPIGAHPKLRQWKIGLCRVLKQINDNAHQIKLPSDLNISYIFNITYPSPL